MSLKEVEILLFAENIFCLFKTICKQSRKPNNEKIAIIIFDDFTDIDFKIYEKLVRESILQGIQKSNSNEISTQQFCA